MHLSLAAPVLAAGFDWLDGLVPLLLAIFWIVSQVVNLVRRPGGDPARPRVEPVAAPRRRPPVVNPGGEAGDARVQLERQIEEFLARSRSGAPAVPNTGRPPRPEPPPLPMQRARPPAPQTARRAPHRPPAATRPSVAARQFDPLGAAGDDVAEHVQDAFKRKLKHLEPSLSGGNAFDAAPPPPAGASGVADDLARAVRDPLEMRRLILLREVLERPVERWE